MESINPLVVVGVLLGVAVVIPAFWCLVVFAMSHLGGWQRLARTYAAHIPPAGKRFKSVSGYVGVVSYRSVLVIHVAPSGFFLEVPALLRIGHAPLFIPWAAVSGEEQVKFLWHRAVRFRVGTRPGVDFQLPAAVLEGRHTSA